MENITRERILKLAAKLQIAAHGRDPDALVSMTARDLDLAAELLTAPLWLSPYEMRMTAAAMDLLKCANADAWTLRQRLDEFERTGPLIKTAESFADWLKNRPNGGVQ